MLRPGLKLESNQEEPRVAGRGAPYNKSIEPTAGGRHVRRLRNGHAGSPPALLLRRRACGPSSRLIDALYGRCEGMKMPTSILLSLVALFLLGCIEKRNNGVDRKVDIEEIEDEYFLSEPDYLQTFTKDLAENAKLGEVLEGEIRITWLPAFSDASIVSLAGDSASLFHFENSRDTFQSTDGNSGKMVVNPNLRVQERKVFRSDNLKLIYRNLVNGRIDTMLSIRKKDVLAFDGILVVVNAKVHGKENGFAFSEGDQYKDRRYVKIGEFVSEITKAHE